MDWENVYSKAIQVEDTSGLNGEECIRLIGQLVDASSILERQKGLFHAIDLGIQVLQRELKAVQKAKAHYFVGNAHSAIYALSKENASREELWGINWEDPKIEPVILNYRRARNSSGFGELPIIRQCQILTNLGNFLNTVGRSISALQVYDVALRLMPRFNVARGNRAFTSGLYARMFYDSGQSKVFLQYAHADIATAVSEGGYVEPEAKEGFEPYAEQLESLLENIKGRYSIPNLYELDLGETDEEQSYRRWCLTKRLFLNPMNDLGAYPIAAHDVIHTPPIVTSIDTGPKYQGAFNQLKQTFVSARFLLYEGLTESGPHFSDRDVSLFNTLDYPSYSLAVEKVKLAFRSFYSLFDQIAFLLNDYFGLAVPARSISFRRIWYRGQDPNQGIRDELLKRYNRPLQALFWLSKDLYESRDDFREALSPAAARLNKIRNHLEHRYLKVHDMWLGEPESDSLKAVRYDDLSESIQRDDFERKALHIAKLARAALIYLSLAMHVENVMVRRADMDGIAMPRVLDFWRDEWKR